MLTVVIESEALAVTRSVESIGKQCKEVNVHMVLENLKVLEGLI